MISGWGRRLREGALWCGALAGLLAMVLGVAVVFFGYGFLIFRSGSMEPGIQTGALALSRDVAPSEIRQGDVLSVVSASGARITHRVVSVNATGDVASVVMQGDTNPAPDSEVYRVDGDQPAQRVVADVPYAGYLTSHLFSGPGLVAVGCGVGALLLGGRRKATEHVAPRHLGSRADRTGRRRAASVVGLALAAGAAGVGVVAVQGADATLAAFNDPAAMSMSATSGTLAAPTAVSCNTSTGAAYVTWTAPSGAAPDSYLVTSTRGTTTDEVFVDADEQLRWRPAATFLFGATYSVTVTAIRGNWQSTATPSANRINSGNFLSGQYCVA